MGIVASIINASQARKKRELDSSVSNFVQNAKGLQESQSQIEQAKQANRQALAEFQNAKTPEEKQVAQQKLIQTAKSMQAAQQSMKISQTNLGDMFNGPKADKHVKMLSKAFGVDDKNADSPERKAAIDAIRKQQQVDEKTARFMSMLPQRQQLTPQAQGEAQLRQAGVVGKPATGGQQLAAQGKQVDQVLKAEKMANDVGLATDKMIEGLPQRGLKEIRDASGNVERNPDGTMKVRNLSLDELKDNPALAEKYNENQTKINLQVAQAKATGVRAMVAQMAEQRKLQTIQQISQPGAIQNWAKLVTDPMSGVTLKDVPAQARGAVINSVAQSGQKIAKPITSEELKRMDLANNAVMNIEEAQSILAKRPDMFGPAGWGKTKFEMAVAGGDPDALRYQAAINLANLPAVGIHGVRGQWALEDLAKLDGNLYLNKDAMAAVLSEIHRSASEFQKLAGRRTEASSTGAQPSPTGKKGDPLGIF